MRHYLKIAAIDKSLEAIKTLHDLGLELSVDLNLSDPWTNYEEFIANLEFMRKINNLFNEKRLLIAVLPKTEVHKDTAIYEKLQSEGRLLGDWFIGYTYGIIFDLKMPLIIWELFNKIWITASISSNYLKSYLQYIRQFKDISELLRNLEYSRIPCTTKEETRQKIEYLKNVIENKGGHCIFYINGEPIRREADVHTLFRLTWHNTISDVSHEVNNGRGYADFKISRGAFDKTLVEFKLASNQKLKRNLLNQVEIYRKASDAKTGYKVIIYFDKHELVKTKSILKELKMENDPNIILIDACKDNKPTGSKA